ncbi:MAG: CRISPR-associated helicase Cas3' [Elusimicrobiota bacterium]|nr:CRISPR-associated helicase Cas3' [Endomicrobiia bacterium]MDW8166425.1 CRISPR-associated helicase Cas3' [Elusimicrobiota bacterium]
MNKIETLYAKSFYEDGVLKTETLEEHTLFLVKNLELLKNIYKEEIDDIIIKKSKYSPEKFWLILRLAVIYHDLGKINYLFQNKIRKLLGQEELKSIFDKEIPHNYLSPALIPLNYLNELGYEDFFMLIYSIIFHHYREIEFSIDYLESYIQEEIIARKYLVNWIKDLDSNFDINNLTGLKFVPLIKDEGKIRFFERKLEFILLKGFLYRLDHSSSAHVEVEKEKIRGIEEKLYIYLSSKENFTGFKSFQEKAKYLREKNVLLTAPTGSGKTEFAINWIGENKSIYTLPLRVSVNSMYERLKRILKEEDKIGLLHGDATYYDLDNISEIDKDIKDHLYKVLLARQLSCTLTVSTADQIFTSFFCFPGYEKFFSLFPYTKIVIDEPQAYSSETLAVIIEGLRKINEIGGKFCLMSATVYPIIKELLKDIVEFIEVKDKTIKQIHILKCYPDKKIEEILDEIILEYRSRKKVLVIVNTVKKAQEVYNQLLERVKEDEQKDINLLHSRFIGKDREKRETKIFEDEKENYPCIWISTQIVEASLDIDFDILFTEIAPIDTLIQRMGRIFRRRKYDSPHPNVIITGEAGNPSGKGHIYDSKLVDETFKLIKDMDCRKINYEIKNELVKQVYSMNILKNSNYYKKFQAYQEILKLGYRADSKNEAEYIFRKISNISAIPIDIYERNKKKLIDIRNKIFSKDVNNKLIGIRELKKYMVDIPLNIKVYSKNILSLENELDINIYIINLKYDENLGLLPKEEINNII